MNLTVITGRLGKDPEIKHTQGGKTLAKFSVAVDEGYGEKKTTLWYNISCWEKTAELVGVYLHKGSKVLVQGRMSSRLYEEKTYWELTADRVEFLDPKSESRPENEPTDADIPF